MAFPTKKHFWTIFPLCPQGPPLKSENFIFFYCRLAGSEINRRSLAILNRKEIASSRGRSKRSPPQPQRIARFGAPNQLLLGDSSCESLTLWIQGSQTSWDLVGASPTSQKFPGYGLTRRAPDYSSNLCPPKIWSIWLFQGVLLGLSYKKNNRKEAQTHPLEKSDRSYFRRAQIRWVVWRSSTYYNDLILVFLGLLSGEWS